MNRLFLVLATSLVAASAMAETPQGQSNSSQQLTNCPPSSAGQTSGTASPDAQAVEKSVILPSAGGERSAANTVQRNGEAVEVRPDCPLDPNQPIPKK